MLALPTVLLLHETADGSHHDWLIGDPTRWPAADARLWTARVAPASHAWDRVGRFELTPLPPHRARYLRYEGPIAGGRGRVERVDAGYAIALTWHLPTHAADPADPAARAGHAVLAVRMTRFTGLVEITYTRPGQAQARVVS